MRNWELVKEDFIKPQPIGTKTGEEFEEEEMSAEVDEEETSPDPAAKLAWEKGGWEAPDGGR